MQTHRALMRFDYKELDVPRFRTYSICWIGFVLLVCGISGLNAKELPPCEKLLPNTTQGFFAIDSVERLSEHWNKTQLGHLMADPVMEPFTKDVKRQFEDRWSGVHERLGLTLKDLQGVPGGDVGIGLIAPAPGKAALALVIDVTGKLDKANELIDKVTETQLKRGAIRTELDVEECPDKVIKFDLPESEFDKKPDESKLDSTIRSEIETPAHRNTTADDVAAPWPTEKISTDDPSVDETLPKADAPVVKKAETDETVAPPEETAPKAPEADEPEPEKDNAEKADAEEDAVAAKQAFYCLTGNLLVITDNLEVLRGILKRRSGDADDSLADHEAFQIVIDRCKSDHGETDPPQMRWYLSPLAYAETQRAATPPDQRRKGKSIIEVMRNQGVGAVQGIGGLADFSTEGFEMVHRTSIYAPKPYENSMKMMVLPNRDDFTPQDWVPRDIATYTTLYFDILNAFDNFGPLFDELVGQGKRGAWEETKESLKIDPHGPQVDLREDLVKYFCERVSMLTDYQLPITTTSERLLFAIEVKDGKAVAKALEKMLKDDPTVERREKAGHIIWEVVGEKAEPPKMEFEFGDLPPVAPARPPKMKNRWEDDEEEEDEPKRLLPHAAITVSNGHLFVASHIDFLLKIIAPEKEPDLLKDDVDYRLVTAEIDKLEPKQKCFRFFSRTDEEYRSTYELIRQNKMPEGETMLARMLNVLFGEGKKGETRTQKIDGSELPEYQVVRRYLGPAGMQVTSEKDGWFLKGFTLSKEAK